MIKKTLESFRPLSGIGGLQSIGLSTYSVVSSKCFRPLSGIGGLQSQAD